MEDQIDFQIHAFLLEFVIDGKFILGSIWYLIINATKICHNASLFLPKNYFSLAQEVNKVCSAIWSAS